MRYTLAISNWLAVTASLYAKRVALGALLACLMAPHQSMAQAFPAKPIRLMVPFAAGGVGDTVARALAERASLRLGQPVIVENRAGGNGLVAASALVASRADGYTLLYITPSTLAAPFVKSPPFDITKGVTLLSPVMNTAYGLVVSSSLPVVDLKGFIAYVKARPGKLSYAAPTPTALLLMEATKHHAGIDLVSIPYKGTAPATMAMLSNEVHAMFSVAATLKPHIDSKKMRLLTVASDKRDPNFPNVPTAAEEGLPNLNGSVVSMIIAPVGIPAEVKDRLSSVFREVAILPEMTEIYANAGSQPVNATNAELPLMLERDIQFWAEAARLANYVAE